MFPFAHLMVLMLGMLDVAMGTHLRLFFDCQKADAE